MTLPLGSPPPDFTLPGIDGRRHSPADYDAAAVFALVQWANGCPWNQMYVDRIKAIQAEYRPRGLEIVAVNSNDATIRPLESWERMIARAEADGLNFAYVKDDEQELARALGS